jgi:hypothetical protein
VKRLLTLAVCSLVFVPTSAEAYFPQAHLDPLDMPGNALDIKRATAQFVSFAYPPFNHGSKFIAFSIETYEPFEDPVALSDQGYLWFYIDTDRAVRGPEIKIAVAAGIQKDLGTIYWATAGGWSHERLAVGYATRPSPTTLEIMVRAKDVLPPPTKNHTFDTVRWGARYKFYGSGPNDQAPDNGYYGGLCDCDRG